MVLRSQKLLFFILLVLINTFISPVVNEQNGIKRKKTATEIMYAGFSWDNKYYVCAKKRDDTYECLDKGHSLNWNYLSKDEAREIFNELEHKFYNIDPTQFNNPIETKT